MSDAASDFEKNAAIPALRLLDGGRKGATLQGGGPGDTFGDMTWQDAVRRIDDKVDDNFKWVLGVFGAGFMILLGAFAAGFLVLSANLNDGINHLDNKLNAISGQVADVRTDVAVLKAVKKP